MTTPTDPYSVLRREAETAKAWSGSLDVDADTILALLDERDRLEATLRESEGRAASYADALIECRAALRQSEQQMRAFREANDRLHTAYCDLLDSWEPGLATEAADG